jgi:hypothetical protein
MEPCRIGRVPLGLGTPDAFVIVERDGRPDLRIDAYSKWEGPFCEVVIWRDFVVLGWSDVVYLVELTSRRVRTLKCDSYFGHLYPFDTSLLVASASELICVNERGDEAWRCGNLGIDGVVVDRVADGFIDGQGEWDPPGGWRPFRLTAITGEPAS